MNRLRLSPLFLLLGLMLALPAARAAEGPFVGVDAGVSEPTNGEYRAHVQTGVSGAPFAGYMFNDYLGLQGEFQIIAQEPDNDNRRFFQPNINNENQYTTILGLTVGPRLQVPLGELLDLYITAQGGGFKGVSGRLNQLAPGFSVGGGLDINITDNIAVGLFGRWNRAYMAPHPYFLGAPEPQTSDEQGPADIRWAVGGVGFKYSFAEAPAPPPPPPPPPVAAPTPPPKKKIVLRSVHFDFDKSNIRKDAVPVLDEAVSILKEEGTIGVIVEGHTDSRGTDAYNMKLSQRRAESVKKYLVDHGVAASRLRTEGFGESKPVASNNTDDGRAQNRRVELHVE